MRRLGAPASLAVVVIALLTVAASSASAASTRAEYIGQADPICAPANKAGSKQLKGYPKDVENRRWKRATRRIRVTLRVFNAEIASLSALQPPVADAPVIDQWLAGLRNQVPLAKSLLAATKRQSFGKVVKRSNRLAKASRNTQKIVAGFGFEACDRT